MLVFPEGTRSPPDGLRRFPRGAAEAAIRAGVSILPLYISARPTLFAKGQTWWHVPSERVHLEVRFLPEIVPGDTDAKTLTREIRQIYDAI